MLLLRGPELDMGLIVVVCPPQDHKAAVTHVGAGQPAVEEIHYHNAAGAAALGALLCHLLGCCLHHCTQPAVLR